MNMTSNSDIKNPNETGSPSSQSTVADLRYGDRSLIVTIQKYLHHVPSLVPLTVLILSIVAFGLILGAKFFSPFALTLILQQVAIVGIVGAAQSLVILTAGIDLSVGAILVFSSVVMGQLSVKYGFPPEIAVAIGLTVGTLCGVINGILVAVAKLPAFIVTLGMWQIILASNFLFSANETIRSQDIDKIAPMLHFFGEKIKIGNAVFTFGVFAMVFIVAFIAYLLKYTAWGRHVLAVGDDADSAELSGISVKRTLISVYGLSGFICAIAGWVMIGRIGSVSPTVGQFTNIESITAVVIGGISLFGGRGSVMGMFFGALIVGVFSLGLRLVGTDPQWTFLFIGVLIIIAVATDQWIRKVLV